MDLWTQLAKKYATDEKVIMGIMNEPYGVDIETWAQVVQAAATAMRGAGATKQMMLLPGILPHRFERFPVHHHI